MSNSILLDKSKDFALKIVKKFFYEHKQNPLINQLIRSGTSIGANVREANYAVSKADFVSKLHIALKECYETEYWLELLIESNIVENDFNFLLSDCRDLKRILVSSCKTAKTKIKQSSIVA